MDAQLHEPFAKQPPECDTHSCSPHPLFTGYGERKRMPTGIKGSRKGSRLKTSLGRTAYVTTSRDDTSAKSTTVCGLTLLPSLRT